MDNVLAATLQAQLALRIQALQTEVEQLREYSNALNERCIADTAELGRLTDELQRSRADLAAERERCAKVAEEFLTRGRSPLGRSVAAAIRGA